MFNYHRVFKQREKKKKKIHHCNIDYYNFVSHLLFFLSKFIHIYTIYTKEFLFKYELIKMFHVFFLRETLLLEVPINLKSYFGFVQLKVIEEIQ